MSEDQSGRRGLRTVKNKLHRTILTEAELPVVIMTIR